jgi:DNA polymerase-1
VAPAAVTVAQRGVGKTVNFAVLYGQSAFGLAGQLSISAAEAKTYIDNYFARYAHVAQYRDQVLERARQTGIVETLLGRRRQFPDLKHANKGLRSAAERMAFNTVFQGTAADIMKRAMIIVASELPRHAPDARMILQVHDELVVEVSEKNASVVATLLQNCMAGAALLKVPLTVDIATGQNWSEC